MTLLLHELPQIAASRSSGAIALSYRGQDMSYGELCAGIDAFAAGLAAMELGRLDRVAIYLSKRFETVVAMFGSVRAGGVFVPVNPVLKPAQVRHILDDCSARILVTSSDRFLAIRDVLGECNNLRRVILIDDVGVAPEVKAYRLHIWKDLIDAGRIAMPPHRVIDADMAAILYTSGSTGRPKGVVLSHANMVAGADSVARYLANTPHDRLLAALPFSFDYGFSQLSTAFTVGASVVLMDYLLPRDILTFAARDGVTGLAGVPPIWSQLAELEWPQAAVESIRYITNSGGAMPGAVLQKLRRQLPKSRVFLMYGLTEAFRSTYLPPEELDRRPGSMGKAIPNAEVLVVRPDGSLCDVDEPGELVHRGSLVALGYWNDAGKTAERFRPTPGQPDGLMLPEIAVWSGDTVRRDCDGYLYYIGRRDEMIKTSGYRVSPTEIEEVVFASGLVADAAAVGIPHSTLGQAIVLVVAPAEGKQPEDAPLLEACRRDLPMYMIPATVIWRPALPRNPNGKYDRAGLAAEYQYLFQARDAES